MEDFRVTCSTVETGTPVKSNESKEHGGLGKFDIEYHYEKKRAKLPFGRVSKTVRREFKPKYHPEDVNVDDGVSAEEASEDAGLPWFERSNTLCDEKPTTVGLDVYSRIGSRTSRTASRHGTLHHSRQLVLSKSREELIHPSKLRSKSRNQDNKRKIKHEKTETVQEHIFQLKRKQASWDNLTHCASDERIRKMRKSSECFPAGPDSSVYLTYMNPVSSSSSLHPTSWHAPDGDLSLHEAFGTQYASTPVSLLGRETRTNSKPSFSFPDDYLQSETASVAPLQVFNQALMWQAEDIQQVPQTPKDNETLGTFSLQST
ncbi:uncharacterized protein LOC106152307 [Lingula anatina]|uniref:Uncharacterized protein LOC106152307 n=1 Tax=Lingula anatina TaxID=7574 RepID=A0A1S3H834_LINAN|nr:uncharacterized protein LOC106152307 [Lingula anatina]|eukprot:XP_013381284.1 uncharacterized protein LOC106152307 [Lingula anatina]